MGSYLHNCPFIRSWLKVIHATRVSVCGMWGVRCKGQKSEFKYLEESFRHMYI